jgi:tetratricopeptide (TPR) repeat protein
MVLIILAVLFATAQRAPGTAQRNLPTTPTGYDKAFHLLQAGQVAEALAELDIALATDPDDPSLNNLRGLAAAQLGRTAEAETSFRKVIRLLPHVAMGYNNLAALLWQSGRHAEGVTAFRQALIEEPHNFTASVGLGTILAERGEYGEALPYLESAWSSRGGDFQAGYELARTLMELKRPAEAQKIITRLVRPKDDAALAKLYALYAAVAEQLGDRAAANLDYRRAFERSPQSFDIYVALVRNSFASRDNSREQLPPVPTTLSADQHFTLGLVFASGGAYSRAISHFQQTLQLQPTNSLAVYNLALAYEREGRSQEAIELLERAVEQQPNAELYDLIASLEEDIGNYVQAVRHYQRAVDLDPGKEQYYFDLGAEYLVHLTFSPAVDVFRVGSQKFPASARLYVGMGLAQFALRRYEEAASAFIEALESDPSSPDAFLAWNALPPFVVVSAWQTVQPHLQRLAERHPTNSHAVFCYGAALSRHGIASDRQDNLDLAQFLLQKAVRLNPRLAPGHLELGTLYAQRKQSNKAIASLLEAIRLDPNSEMAHYRLGQIYRDLNQLKLAERELSIYRTLSKNHRDQMAQTRSAIRQFVLAKPDSESALMKQSP